MPRFGGLPLLFALVVFSAAGRSDDLPLPADVQALQDCIQRTIDAAEPSIACILVSRSDEYRRFQSAPPDEESGRLGRFDGPALLRQYIPEDMREPTRETRRLVKELDLSSPDVVPESYGSGVVVDADKGLVLTMAHVVHNATKIYVRLPGGRGSWADVHAADPRSDLAVLRMLDVPDGLKAISYGDGLHLRKGQFVVSLANPFAAGFRDGSPSASWGVISNLHRRASGVTSEIERPGVKPTLHHYGTLIQTDVRMALGCSGGALLDLNGKLIGLTTAQAALSGSEAPGGFAVPMDAPMKRIIDVLMHGDEVEYGFLGVKFEPDARPGRGVMIEGVASGSPAERGGLVPGDLITAINGAPVHDIDDLYLQIGIGLAGGPAKIEVIGRDGRPRICNTTLMKSYTPGKAIASHRPPAVGGLRVDYTSILAQRISRQDV
ncbi:MAG TPA: trypsin-like peptidase domain-containing protein, partial [Gemmataceae bacterium]|nr:trypsin-like peptidase domain-containing protein [Gemmataceae bacterium]